MRITLVVIRNRRSWNDPCRGPKDVLGSWRNRDVDSNRRPRTGCRDVGPQRGDAMALAMFTRLSETEAMVPAVFLDKARLDLRPLLGLTATNSDADREAAAPRGHGKSSDIDGFIPMPPDQALHDLHRNVHNHRVPMTAIKCDGISDEQIPVPPVELNDLIFRLVPGHLVGS